VPVERVDAQGPRLRLAWRNLFAAPAGPAPAACTIFGPPTYLTKQRKDESMAAHAFPRTTVGGLSLSRMIIGTNWFLGYSHCSNAKDKLIKQSVAADRKKLADILEVFFRAGVDTIMGLITVPPLHDAIQEAEQRTGVKGIIVATPAFPVTPELPVKGFNLAEVRTILDEQKRLGTAICMPHQSTTDVLVDRCMHTIRHCDQLCAEIRSRGMLPGLSTHMPEAIVYADETKLDVETYISIFNSMGFLMQIEVDWTSRIIAEAKKPVMTIKPFASGQLRPFQGLTFVWNAIRPCDMVTVGTMTPDEAAECIELSLAILERRESKVKLQETRSKASVKKG
jgi:hypothetical protein